MTPAIGFRAHMGWADAVTLSVTVGGLTDVIDRRVLELRPAVNPSHPYHAAREADPDEREAIIAGAEDGAEAVATDALAELAAELGFAAVGVVVSRGLRNIPLDKVLASSRLIHAAEAAIYQRALRTAAANLGLPCHTIGFPQAEAHPRWPDVAVLGRVVGPPWRKDHKLAAVAALTALEASGIPGP